VRNAVPRIDDQAFLEAADRQTEHETVRGETVQSRDSVDIFSSVLDKFRNTDAPAVNDVKNETVAELLKQAKETIEQLKPGLIELASLAARRNEKQTMRMRLHPAELGTVDISLERNSAGGLNAHFNTANDSAREVLTHNLDQLRESLQNAGWQVGQLQVSSGSSPFTSANDQRDRQPQSETFRGHMPGNSAEQSDQTEQDTSRLLNLRA
jgi:flagellar hook-length control protein FliK